MVQMGKKKLSYKKQTLFYKKKIISKINLNSYKAFSPDVIAAMVVYPQEKNFDSFLCLGHQHGSYSYSFLCLLAKKINPLRA